MLCTSPQNTTVTYELMLFGFTWYLGIHRWVAFNWAWVKGSHKFSMRNLFVKYALNLKIWSQHMTWNFVLLQLLHETIRLLIVQLTVLGPHPPQAYQSCYSGVNDLSGVFYRLLYFLFGFHSVHSVPHEDFYYKTGNWIRM